ncbi:hypothetical protein BC332_25620 [Capsicum chinense]|nr:hypothetical protein BC332_25620 [Capsicum chinense]
MSQTNHVLKPLYLKDPLKETPENDNQSPEVTSKAATIDNEAKESPNKLKEKLSAALVNFLNEQDVETAKQNANQDGNANEQSPDDHDIGVAEQSADPDGDTDE